MQKSLFATDQIKKSNTERCCKIKYGPPFKLFRFPNPIVELSNILIKIQKSKQQPKIICNRLKNVFTTNNFENYNLKVPNPLYGLIFLCHLHVICMLFVCTHILSICTHMSYVSRMYAYVIRMSLICARMSSICHSYILL